MFKIKEKNQFCLFSIMVFILIACLNSNAQTELSDSLVRERLLYIQTKLNDNKSSAKLWWYGWMVGYGAATVGQGFVYFKSKDKSLKEDMALGAATTFLGVVGQILTPLGPGYKTDCLTKLPENTTAESQTKLTYAENLLGLCAKREIDGRSWQTHAICSIVNLSGGIITWIGFKRSVWAGVGNFALNTLVTEAQIWSQPTRSVRDFKYYNRKYKLETTNNYKRQKLKWYANIYPGGIMVKLYF